MTLQDLSALLQSEGIQKNKEEAVIVIINTGEDSQTYVSGTNQALKGALMSSMIGEEGVCNIVVDTVNQMHKLLRKSLHEVFAENGVVTKFVPGMKGGEE